MTEGSPYEACPERMRKTREFLTRHLACSYSKTIEPFVREGNVTLKVVGARTSDRIRFGRDWEFSFRFAPDRPGLWTLVFHTTAVAEDRPVPGGAASAWVEERER